MQRGAEGPSDFIQYVELFGAPRSLLNQVAVLDGHADLVAQRQEKPQLGGREAPAVRRAEKQDSESLLLGLKADGHHAAKSLRERQFAEATDGLLFFESRERVVTKVAETQQAAEPRHKADEIIVQALILSCAAKIITQPDGNDGSRALRIPVMQKERASRKPNHAQNSIQGLRQHALNLAADKAGGRQVEIRKRQHVALDAALFLFVERHDHEHGHERAWRGANDAHARALKFRRGVQHLEGNPEDSPRSERNAQEPIGKRLLPPALLPEHHCNPDVQQGRRNDRRNGDRVRGIGRGPKSE